MVRSFLFHRPPYLSSLLVIIALLISLCASQTPNCTESDYEAAYTQCRPTNTHDLIWYKKRGVSCTPTMDDPIPDSVFDLPCNITCDEGHYLPLGALSCSPCGPGSFTRGGGASITEWDSFPTDIGVFSTYCVNNLVPNSPPINCSGWTLTGSTVRSGRITDTQSSILVLQTQLLIAGVVRFSYRVDAEPNWDGLIFYVDDVVILPKVSVTYFYVDFSANVSAGYHTFKWEYYKDRSESRGEDAAYIRSFELSGITYAESSCTPCEPGTFTDEFAAIQCTPCLLNTFMNESGSTGCTQCPDGEYALVGATQCSLKMPCTSDDYQILYGACTQANTRTATANWLLPKICDDSSFHLPDPTTVPCSACPPGTAQDASFNCNPCSTGSYSAGGGASCLPCGAGNAAHKVFNFSTFDSWPQGVSTSCTGYCGTNGWRLRSNFIDSGAGHGTMVDSSITIDLTLEQPGYVTFTFSLNCSRFCALFYLDYPYDASVQWNTTSVGANNLVTYTTPTPLEIGAHTLTWTFEEEPYDPTPLNGTDSVQVYSIVVTGTTTGGASTCTPCLNGTVAGSGSSYCTNCSAGYTSNSDRSACEICAGNTFSPQQGSNCYQCGPTTTVNSNHTDCVDTCSFTLDGVQYDITALAGKAYGPVYYDIYYYYINLCGRGNFAPDCISIDDEPLLTHVCQVLPYGYALDVGWTSGYYSIPTSTAARGFRVHYDLGTLGCGPKNNGIAYPRNSDLTFICDPSAGLGILETAGVLEDPPCHYNFEWRSLYACPVCTVNDYSFYYTLCGSNGKRTKVYYWNDPILCHDGVKLPSNEVVGCSDSTVVCGIGQRLGDDGVTCVPCPVGQYSVGGGLLISSWPIDSSDLPYDYSSNCIGGCTNWVSDDGISIHSGVGDSSLTGSHNFRTSGSISFNYKVYAPAHGVFTFSIDGVPQLQISSITLYDWAEFNIPISSGSHVFQWRFSNGIRYSLSLFHQFESVSISNIFVQGLDYHADTCLPCPDGTYSSSDPTIIGCVPCPANTYNTGQTSQCTPCDSDQYSLPGSAYCLNKTECTSSSYVPVYTPCVNNTRDVSYTKLLPDSCIGGFSPPPDETGVPCAPCPAYTILVQGGCQSCPSGQYYLNGQCQANVAGYVVQYSQEYFGDTSSSYIPSPFFTGCSGVCGTSGWRVAGASLDSGYHVTNAVDSYVGLLANFVFQGQVVFTYLLNTNGSPLNGLQFSIDDVVIEISVPADDNDYVTVSLPVSSGEHKMVWNYHQESVNGNAVITNITLLGVEGAIGAGASLPCPTGQFANDSAALYCTNCGPGYFASVPGSSGCSPCAKNTYNPYYGAATCLICDAGSATSETGSTQCQTDCIFELDGDTFDLTGLPGTVTIFDNARRKYLINVCNNIGDPCPHSHACIVNVDGSTIDAGNSFRFAPDNSSALPFSIFFEHGDTCPGTTVKRATQMQFECDSEYSSSLPAYVSEDENCLATISWSTLLACRKCTDSDYTIVRGVCSGGHRKMSKTRISACNGEAVIPIPDESCSGREFPLGAILAIVFVFIAVVAVAGFIFFRNRRLAAQYASLVEETRSSNVTL